MSAGFALTGDVQAYFMSALNREGFKVIPILSSYSVRRQIIWDRRRA
jgi:hypothetical protein